MFQGWRPPQKSIAADAGGRGGGGDGSGSALKTPQPDDAKEEDGGGDLARDSGGRDVRVRWVGGDSLIKPTGAETDAGRRRMGFDGFHATRQHHFDNVFRSVKMQKWEFFQE